MFKESLLKEIRRAQAQDKPVAVAMVVRREAPTSGKPGDKAIITAEGNVHGWIGGGCTKGIVIKEALEALKDETPRLVKIQTGIDSPELEGVKNYKMTCMSGGSVEVYIEPIMPVTEIYIFGRSHIAKALCEIGAASGFRMNIISALADNDMFPAAASISSLDDFTAHHEAKPEYVVVCTQGEDDARHLEAALKLKPTYIGFVSSRKKANSVLMGLKRSGVSHDILVGIKTPAGIDIEAKTPEEVAISILAEIIQSKRKNASNESNQDAFEAELDEDLYINPVCKIPVQKSSAKYILDYEGEKVYFCCDGCKESFEKNPAAYME